MYKLSQEVNNDHDTYDSCVVVADSEEEALKIHPNYRWDIVCAWVTYGSRYIKVEYLGEAREGLEGGTVVCASFNAG